MTFWEKGNNGDNTRSVIGRREKMNKKTTEDFEFNENTLVMPNDDCMSLGICPNS